MKVQVYLRENSFHWVSVIPNVSYVSLKFFDNETYYQITTFSGKKIFYLTSNYFLKVDFDE